MTVSDIQGTGRSHAARSPGTNRNSADRIRRDNLSVVLTMLHRQGPLSRAQLTKSTGFNRSTVGALVAELAGLELAYETEPPVAGRVGRPSPLVHANDKVAAIPINPDVDAVTVGLVGLGGRVHRRIRYEAAAPPSVRETVNISKAILEGMQADLSAMDRIVGIGVAVPGLVRSADGTVLLAPHLNWESEPLSGPLGQALHLPVTAANDATLGSLAESLYGAAKGAADVVYLNGSASGIGGGIITGGSPLPGAAGYAGELGHTLVNSSGQPCHCGRTGCLETEVNLDRLLNALGLERADQDQLEAAMARNPSGQLLLEVQRQLDMLAVALTNTVNIFNPEVIVLGGFLGTLFALDPDRLTSAVAGGAIGGLGRHVRIERAALRSELLLVGAAELAFGSTLSNPVLRHDPDASQSGPDPGTAPSFLAALSP